MPLLARPEIQGVTVCPHGGIDYAELEMLGIAPQDIIDFSANLNPFGPPPSVIEVLSEHHCGEPKLRAKRGVSEAISHYPDSEAYHLRRSLAEKLGIKAENIIVGNGSTELIHLAALAYFGQGDKVLIIEPTFGEYQVACQIAGASLIKQRLSAENAFLLDIDETVGLIKRYCPKGIFICNPNNPTARYLSRADFKKVLDASGESLVVLDEAYISFVDSHWSSLGMIEGSNLLVLRSMTKDYALAGLRLGYGVAREEIIVTLRRISLPWNVNALAQKAGIIAIKEGEYLKRCQIELSKAKKYLIAEFSRLGLPPLPSEANFFLVEVGDAPWFRRELLKRKMLVRDCTSFGLPHYVRIAPRTLPECQSLVDAVRELVVRGLVPR